MVFLYNQLFENKIVSRNFKYNVFIVFCLLLPNFLIAQKVTKSKATVKVAPRKNVKVVKKPIKKPVETKAALIKYGEQLIANTAIYLGPNGKIAKKSNGMNCQNCHLDAGTRIWGNNYFGVASTYPKFRERSGTSENLIKRINDCFERSLNGQSLDSTSREMRAMITYIQHLGRAVPKDSIPKGTGIWKVPYMDRAADPSLGKIAYEAKCTACHLSNGQGMKTPNGKAYQFPPLWGANSYNSGAGLFRLSRLAGYIKTNMPLGTSAEEPQLTDEEAWDIAAFINSQPRPSKDLAADWPRIAGKPIDHPFGPYVDLFNENQHKYGPFKPIEAFYKEQKRKKEHEEKLKIK